MTRQYRPKTCEDCGGTYTPTGANQKYCPGCAGHRRAEINQRSTALSYQRRKDDPEFREQDRQRSREWRETHKDHQRDYLREHRRRLRKQRPDTTASSTEEQ